ncbi:hypothetical protein OAO01_04675 [Oligoflexia bacterium]|nr:hypothetical protein [Oligoflexia bacterium]
MKNVLIKIFCLAIAVAFVIPSASFAQDSLDFGSEPVIVCRCTCISTEYDQTGGMMTYHTEHYDFAGECDGSPPQPSGGLSEVCEAGEVEGRWLGGDGGCRTVTKAKKNKDAFFEEEMMVLFE